jgi:CubicO group peptidase (beta-lactamase class C family)
LTVSAGFSLLFVLPVGLVAATTLSAQAGPPGWGAAIKAFDALIATDNVVGGSLVLARNGAIVSRHDAGEADRARHQPVVEGTLFHWGSITKTLTAVGILQLRDRGLLSLDDPITRWVPELRQLHNPYGSMDAITLRMLLSHSAGFQNPTWPYTTGADWEPFEPTSWGQLVAMMPYQKIHFQPGSKFGYSNPAYIYLARVIESLTGDPWQSYVYKNLWGPLGIRESYFNRTPWHLDDRRSAGYSLGKGSDGREGLRENGREFDPGITIPNGGWNGPVGDLVAWGSYLAGASVSGGTTNLLSRATLEEMWRPVVRSAEGESVGLGFFVWEQGGRRIVGHTGEQGGFRSFLCFDPAAGAVVVGVVNTTNDARREESDRAFLRAAQAARQLLTP